MSEVAMEMSPRSRKRKDIYTAFATKEEADTEGKKSEHDKFAGGLYTTTVEAFVPNTKGNFTLQKCLKFVLMMGKEEKEKEEQPKGEFICQNSWAYTMRTIGVMIMVHGDDKGLVLPPKVASLQVM
ncbi:proline--tRNA ligase [Salvia divinorum]|uniref:Proline--tRNA ligase n=1 Tax=Salvia divinorum TaxID=28513 RepID=A0ABD1GUI2_SALDI